MRTTEATTPGRSPAGLELLRGLEVLEEPEWLARAAAHAERVDALTAGHRGRAGRKHPVEDFLFTYYSLRPAGLRRWHPGVGVALAGRGAHERLSWRHHTTGGGASGSDAAGSGPLGGGAPDEAAPVTLDVAAFLERRGGAVRHIRALLAATASRPARLGCFGLHEWAMVYRLDPSDVRHAGWPPRLGSAGTDAVVESHRIRCSHHDAFRFFAAAARPRNALQPRREDQVALEQPGCLHTTMDLYKWAYKLLPATPSELVADCFELARDVRTLDMRASPYDFSALGHDPVRIETSDGKAEYAAAQRGFAERAAPVRAALLAVCDRLLVHDDVVRDRPKG